MPLLIFIPQPSLSKEQVAVETIAAVDVPVTVEACRAHHLTRPYPARQLRGRAALGLETDVVESNVTLPAQPDGRLFQQGGISAAVGLMAIEAILHDGRVLKNVWPPVLGVTIEAKFSRGNSFYELGRRRPVRVVATRTAHLSLAHGMMRKLPLRANLLFMTCFTCIIDGQIDELITTRCSPSRVRRVACCASEVFDGMNTVIPEKPIPLLMALETGLVALVSRICGPFRKSNHAFECFAS